MEHQQGKSIGDMLGGIRRRAWIVGLVFLIGTLIAVGTAYLLPPVYESTARIQVQSQQIPGELARSTVTASAAERLQQIEQLLLTRENVLDIIDRLGLLAYRTDLSTGQKVDLVRANTFIVGESFDGSRRPRDTPTLSSFTITYQATNPAIASRVANEFVTRMLEQNLRARTELATETRAFFEKEVRRLADDLLQLEAEIAAYKNENESALPENLDFRLRELSTLEERLFEIEQRRIEVAEQRQALRDSIDLGLPGTGAGAQQTPEERDLATLRRQLTEKRALFADSHPEIRALNARIAALEQTVNGAAEAAAEEASSSVADQRQIDRRRLTRQLALVENQLSLIEEQRIALEDRRTQLEESIKATPRVEMALSALQRRYADLNAQYEAAVVKEAEAATGERLEINQQAERFEVIEQAQPPEGPIAPNRPLIAAAGAVGSLGAGIVLALLLELSSSVIRTSADLERRLQLRPIVTLPYIRTRTEIRRRVVWRLVQAVVLVVVVSGVLYAVDQNVAPLQVIWDRFAERIGLDSVINAIMQRI